MAQQQPSLSRKGVSHSHIRVEPESFSELILDSPGCHRSLPRALCDLWALKARSFPSWMVAHPRFLLVEPLSFSQGFSAALQMKACLVYDPSGNVFVWLQEDEFLACYDKLLSDLRFVKPDMPIAVMTTVADWRCVKIFMAGGCAAMTRCYAAHIRRHHFL